MTRLLFRRDMRFHMPHSCSFGRMDTHKKSPEGLYQLVGTVFHHLLLSAFFSFATETDIALPSISLLLRPWIASLASLSSAISTNPKPRLRPDSLSVITLAEETVPYFPNNSLKFSSVVWKLKFETYMFIKQKF